MASAMNGSSASAAVAPALELEHIIGFNAGYGHCATHPSGESLYYLAGGNVICESTTSVHEQTFMRGTDGEAGLMCLSTSGRFLVTAQTTGGCPDAVVWDMVTKTVKFRVSEHEHKLAAMAMSSDEKLLLTVGGREDRRIVVWDVASGGIVSLSHLSSAEHGAEATACAWGGEVEDVKRRKTGQYQFAIAIGCHLHRYTLNPREAGSIAMQRTAIGNVARKWTSLAYAGTGDLLFAGSETGDVTVISTLEGTGLKTLKVFNAGVRYIAVHATQVAANGTGDGGDGGFRYARFGGHATRSTTLTLGGGGGQVVTGVVADHANPTFKPQEEWTLSGAATALSLSAKGVTAGTGAGNVFSLTSGDPHPHKLITSALGEVHCVAYHPYQSDRFATGSADGVFRMWDLSGYSEICHGAVGCGEGRRARGTQPANTTLREGNFGGQGSGAAGRQGGLAPAVAAPRCIAHVGQTDTAVTGWSDGAIRCFDTIDGEMHWDVPNAMAGAVTDLCVTQNLNNFVTSGEHGEVKVWNLKTHTLAMELKEHKSKITGLQLCADDRHLLSCSKDRSILTWDLTTGQRVATNMLSMGQIHSMFLCANQNNFLTTGSDRKVSLWDLRQAEPVRQVDIHQNVYSETMAYTISGSHDGRFFATGGNDQVVTLWDQATLRPIQQGVAHTSPVSQVRFAPDDRQLLSCGGDRCVMVWNLYA
eukprot:TRINITY_DN11764_c0_g1_i1.p1 TRINITY_DN11764_c0_g1~~TRINITY_DN11764_c0_g1_i1.p1  ORF type:complete len:702 (+),score=226.37 TRINITY_DN11764_c0_g1_i1:67-2172(+)